MNKFALLIFFCFTFLLAKSQEKINQVDENGKKMDFGEAIFKIQKDQSLKGILNTE